MLKKIISSTLMLLIICTFLPYIYASDIIDSGSCGAQGGNLTWTLDSAGALTIRGTGKMANDPSFNGHRSDIKHIIFDGYITSIGENAFRSCENLNSINIPDSVISIGCAAFKDTAYYKNPDNWDKDNVLYIGTCLISAANRELVNYTIKDGTTVIAFGAFCTYKSALTKVIIPDSVRGICERAFYSCSELTEAKLPGSLEIIEYEAFGGCSSLNSINIPSSTKLVEPGAFAYSGSLLITVSENNPFYSSEHGVLFNKDKTEILAYAKDKVQSDYTISDSVKTIGEDAFGWCENLENVNIPNSVTKIKENAFIATSLKKIEIPGSVTSIGECAFQWCEDLEIVYYAGTEEDWNNMEEHDSTGLVGVPVRFNYTPLKFIGTPALNIANGEYIISVKLQNVNNACKIFVALINGKGVSGFGEANIKEGQTEASVSVSAESAQTAKIFIWNSLGGMTPLCKPKIISVTQGI